MRFGYYCMIFHFKASEAGADSQRGFASGKDENIGRKGESNAGD